MTQHGMTFRHRLRAPALFDAGLTNRDSILMACVRCGSRSATKVDTNIKKKKYKYLKIFYIE